MDNFVSYFIAINANYQVNASVRLFYVHETIYGSNKTEKLYGSETTSFFVDVTMRI